MNTLNEIIETTDNIMSVLVDAEFFYLNEFVDGLSVRTKLETQMQRNWEQKDDMYLTDEQFMDIIRESLLEAYDIHSTYAFINGLWTADSLDSNGKLVYKINESNEIRQYLQSI